MRLGSPFGGYLRGLVGVVVGVVTTIVVVFP